MNEREIQVNLQELAVSLNQTLSEAQLQDIYAYVQAWEFGLALETICDFLYEDHLLISENTYKQILELGVRLNMNTNLLNLVAKLVK